MSRPPINRDEDNGATSFHPCSFVFTLCARRGSQAIADIEKSKADLAASNARTIEVEVSEGASE